MTFCAGPFDKPLIATVQGAAIGGGTAMLTHCDFVYAGEGAKFAMPFVKPCPGAGVGSRTAPFRRGSDISVRKADLILLAQPFDAGKAVELGLVTQVVPDQNLMTTASETARKLGAKPAEALQASKRLMKRSFREQIKAAMQAENDQYSARVRSEDAREAFAAFLQKRPPNFNRTTKAATAA